MLVLVIYLCAYATKIFMNHLFAIFHQFMATVHLKIWYAVINQDIFFFAVYFASLRILVLKNDLRYTIYPILERMFTCCLFTCWTENGIACTFVQWQLDNANSPRGKHPVNNHNPTDNMQYVIRDLAVVFLCDIMLSSTQTS